jgi:type IV secretion system protein VirB10
MATRRVLAGGVAVLVALHASGVRPEAAGADAGPIVSFRLTHPITTASARVGDAVSLRTTAPIEAEGVSIPAGSPAQGVITRVVRPGRIRGRAQLALRVVSVTHPDGRLILVTANAWAMEAPRRRPRPPDPTMPILTGMAAGYGTAMIASQFSDSAETIAGAGVAPGVATLVLVAVLQRGEDLALGPGFRLDVGFDGPDVLMSAR